MKYKVGDKVVIRQEGSHGFKIGEVVTITKLYPNEYPPYYKAEIDNDYAYVCDPEIKPYIEETHKMKTRDKDYTGCHPQIAEALKQGKEVWCRVWENNPIHSKSVWIIDYMAKNYHSYATNDDCFKNAEPIITKTVVKKASEIVKWLEDNEYECGGGGDWFKENHAPFFSTMFRYCQKEQPEDYNWLPEWLEEVDG